jgi:hypothetical protein
MAVSYKDKLRLLQDEQFSNPFNEKDKTKATIQKGLFIAITISTLIYYLFQFISTS